MKSPIADMKNTGSRYGGSITAALFLKQYVKDEVEWAHMDMAGGCGRRGHGGWMRGGAGNGGWVREVRDARLQGHQGVPPLFFAHSLVAPACFLPRRFSPWCPLSSRSGPVWDEKAGLPTGFGAATLAEWVNIRAA